MKFMVLRVLLLLISASSFVTACLLGVKREQSGSYLISLFALLLISFIGSTVLYLISERCQGILKKGLIKKVMLIVFLAGFIIIVGMGFLMHYDEDGRVVWGTIDSVAYFIQAKIFSTGHINVPSHELKDFFTTGYCINDGKYYSMYFPGWPLLLSAGIALGVPWLINPILGIVAVLLMYLVGKEIYDRETGLFAAALLLYSRCFYVLTPTYFSEPSALVVSSLFAYCSVRTLKEPRVIRALLAGLLLGILFLIRPYTAFGVSLPVIGYLVLSVVQRREKAASSLLILILSFLPMFFMLFLYNYLQTGSVFLTPFQKYNPSNMLGFGLRSFDIIMNPQPYTLINAVRNTIVNMAILNLETVPFLFLFLMMVFINRANKWDKLLLATLASIIFLHMFYFYREPRYYYPGYFALFLLAARGISLSGVVLRKYFSDVRIRNLNYFIVLFILVANVFIIISPAKPFHDFRSGQKMRDPFSIVKEKKLRNAVVFLRQVPINYVGLYVQNPLDFNGDVLFVRDLKERNGELMQYYPHRDFYYYDFKAGSGKLTKIN